MTATQHPRIKKYIKQTLSRYCSRIKRLKKISMGSNCEAIFVLYQTFKQSDLSSIHLAKASTNSRVKYFVTLQHKEIDRFIYPTILRQEVVKRHFRVSINLCSLKKGTHIWVNYSKSFSTCKTDAFSLVQRTDDET